MTCLVVGCNRARARDAAVCGDCLNDLWCNRLVRIGAVYVFADPARRVAERVAA